MGKRRRDALRLGFDRSRKLEFLGANATSYATPTGVTTAACE